MKISHCMEEAQGQVGTDGTSWTSLSRYKERRGWICGDFTYGFTFLGTEKGLKTRPNPRSAPKVLNKGTHVQSNVSSPESDKKGPSQRAAWKVQHKVKKPPQELEGEKREATPVGNTSNSFKAWKKNSSSEYDSGSESDDGQGKHLQFFLKYVGLLWSLFSIGHL